MTHRQPPQAAGLAATEADLQRLAPLRLRRSGHGLVGPSRHAAGLRRSIRDCRSDPSQAPVLVVGEAGLEKANLVALIHFGSNARHRPLVRLEGAALRERGLDPFAEPGAGQDSLLGCLSRSGASLLVAGLDRVAPPLRRRLLDLAQRGCWQNGADGVEREFSGRLYFTAEASLPEFATQAAQQAAGRWIHTIKVPPLRARRQDLEAWTGFEVRRLARLLGWSTPPRVGRELLHQLLCADFPGNHRELHQRIEAGMRRCAASLPAELPAEAFRSGDGAPARFDLWRWRPGLLRITRLPAAWNRLLLAVVAAAFVLFNLWLWLGPAQRSGNGALLLFWAWWWPLMVLALPLLGRLWCAVCPFMVWGEICQALVARTPWQPAHWPRGDIDRWAAPLLAGGFALILLWEELANLPNAARLSSCLLLLISAGAVVCSLLFEKRFWCRFLCPVGGMNGLFAKLSISELRARLGICSGSCSSYFCCKGDPAQATLRGRSGCPEGYHPGHLGDNRNCVMCLTCASVCPHGSVQFRLRPPGADLQPTMAPPAGEAGLILVLAGGICLHHWQRLLGWSALAPDSLQNGPWLPRLSFALLALALPAVAFLMLRLLWSLGRRWRRAWRGLVAPTGAAVGRPAAGTAKAAGGKAAGGCAAIAAGLEPLPPAQEPAPPQWLLLYGLLPLLWSLLLARHLPLGMGEAGRLLPVSVGSLWPVTAARLPSWSGDPHVVGFSQCLVILVGIAGSVVLVRRLLGVAGWSWLLLSGLCLGLGIGGRLLVAPG